VSLGKRVKISYSGMFLDGKPIDDSEQIIEYVYGTPDQLIKGLNIVIGSLKKGETSKIIVPSRLAFGESGSSNGSIPPYTPLVYNLKIIDIK
jgi:FKBP-type peptidyl-prolyl cis-trans isomerase